MSGDLQGALALLQRGDLAAALSAFELLLTTQPNDLATLSAYASALRRAGQMDPALALYGRALKIAPNEPALHFNHANALHAAGRSAEGRRSYQMALNIDANFVPAWVNLGRLEQDLGHFAAAEQAYARALMLQPAQRTALMNRGNCLRRLGKFDEAGQCHQQALALTPRHAESHYNLGNVLRDQGRLEAALAAYSEALEADPAPIELWSRLGACLQELGQSEQALRAFDRGRTEHPRSASAHCNYGHMAMRLGQIEPGIQALRLAVRLQPGEPIATAHLVDALVRTGFIAEAVGLAKPALAAATRNADQARLHNVLGMALGNSGLIEAALDHLQQAHQLQPDASSISNLAFMSLYSEALDGAGKAQRQRELAAQLAGMNSARSAPVGDSEAAPDQRAVVPIESTASAGGGRLRIGYLSADLLEHPVGFFMLPLLRTHDRSQFEVFVYSDSERGDALTEQLQQASEHWRAVRGMDDAALERQMRADGLDLLIELGGHTAGNRLPLLNRRPAPRQLSYLGYPFSTGLATVDALLGDAVTTPVADDPIYHEQIRRLPHFPFCFQPHPSAPPVAAAPVATRGHLSFGCFNSFNKIGPRTLALWAKLLQSLPESRLILRAVGLNDHETCDRVRREFADRGVAPERLQLLPPVRPIEAYLAGYAEIDIALDPLAYNGGTTSFEALWQGVPVLTIAGTGFCARMGAGINATAGLEGFTATNEAEFLRLAQHWSDNAAELIDLRAVLRSRLAQSPLFDPARFMPGYESALAAVAGQDQTGPKPSPEAQRG